MNTEIFKTFCDLIDTGSFSRAAEANYVSQSAVSQQLAKLEKEFGTQLVSRGGGLLAPTEAGKALYQGASEILRRFEQLVGEVRSAADSVRGVLRVGTIYSVGFYLLDPFIRKFLRSHTEVTLHVEYARWNRIYTAVANGEMDLGVVACPEKHRAIEIVPLSSEELVAVFPPNHPLASKSRISASDLKGQRFVAFEANIPTRRQIDKLLHDAGVEVRLAMEFDNIELLKRAVAVGSGISILPLDNVEREASYGELAFAHFKDAENWVRPVGILRRRGKAPGPAERIFLAILRSKPEQ